MNNNNNNNVDAINNNHHHHIGDVDGYRCDFENFQKYDVYTIDDDDEYLVDSF